MGQAINDIQWHLITITNTSLIKTRHASSPYVSSFYWSCLDFSLVYPLLMFSFMLIAICSIGKEGCFCLILKKLFKVKIINDSLQ